MWLLIPTESRQVNCLRSIACGLIGVVCRTPSLAPILSTGRSPNVVYGG